MTFKSYNLLQWYTQADVDMKRFLSCLPLNESVSAI